MRAWAIKIFLVIAGCYIGVSEFADDLTNKGGGGALDSLNP